MEIATVFFAIVSGVIMIVSLAPDAQKPVQSGIIWAVVMGALALAAAYANPAIALWKWGIAALIGGFVACVGVVFRRVM